MTLNPGFSFMADVMRQRWSIFFCFFCYSLSSSASAFCFPALNLFPPFSDSLEEKKRPTVLNYSFGEMAYRSQQSECFGSLLRHKQFSVLRNIPSSGTPRPHRGRLYSLWLLLLLSVVIKRDKRRAVPNSRSDGLYCIGHFQHTKTWDYLGILVNRRKTI